jgi:hypothetical protein
MKKYSKEWWQSLKPEVRWARKQSASLRIS